MLVTIWGYKVKLIKITGVFMKIQWFALLYKSISLFLFFKCVYFGMLNHNISCQKPCRKFTKN